MLLTKTLVKRIIPKATIIEAIDGKEAVAMFKEQKPQMILMDIQMPIMKGYEDTEKIRKINKDCIIIALTAGIITGEREICLSIGMNDYITKPINREILESTIIKWAKTIKK